MSNADRYRLRNYLPTQLVSAEESLRNDLEAAVKRDQPGMGSFLESQAIATLDGGLDIDVIEVLARGWATVRELRDLRDEKRYPPGKTITVSLGKHDFKTSVHPVLKLTINGAEAGELQFDCDIKAAIVTVNLEIKNRHLVAVHVGDGEVSVQLKYKEVPLHKELKSPVVTAGRHELKKPGFEVVAASAG